VAGFVKRRALPGGAYVCGYHRRWLGRLGRDWRNTFLLCCTALRFAQAAERCGAVVATLPLCARAARERATWMCAVVGFTNASHTLCLWDSTIPFSGDINDNDRTVSP